MLTSTPRRPIAGLILAALCLVTMISSAVADSDDPMAEGRERFLNGHGFLPSVYIDTPFVSSNFSNLTGGGMAMSLETTLKDLEGNDLYTLEGDLFFATLGFGYQQKLGTKWALGANVAGLVKSGTNAESFLTEGADVNRSASLWVKYRLKRTKASQLSVGLNWAYSKTLYFTPWDFARGIANDVPIDDAPILVDNKVWTSRLVINWARGFSQAFGVRVNAEFGLYEVPETSDVSKGSHRIGVLGELDLQGTKAGIPLGFTLGYTQTLPSDDPNIGLSGVVLGAWYTGKQAFVVGAEGGLMTLPVAQRDIDEVKTLFGIITIKYYF